MSFELISEQERQRKYDVTMRNIRATIVAVEKQEVLHILSVRVFLPVASDPQREMSMRHIAICSFSSSTTFFHTKNHKLHDFPKKEVTEHKKCFDFIYNIFLKHLSF
jgi:hypothetical protein